MSGVYIHIPFCARRCDYCAFATWTDRDHLIPRYAAACRAELAGAGLVPAATVFVGGGTPSRLPAALLGELLAAVPLAPGAEVTVECNPDDVTPALLAAYVAAGVTRVSLGVQSTVGHVRAALGRAGSLDALAPAVAAVRAAGLASWNIDLILGAAGESMADWQATVATVLDWEPPHVSAYALTVEPGTPLWRDPARWPDDDDQAAKYLWSDAAFTAAGLGSYEISNWSRPGHECRHNLGYWAQGDYRGIGCAAHSHQAGRRWWNVRDPARYIELVAAGRPPVAGQEQLGEGARRHEALQLALRTNAGVPAAALAADAAADLAAAGLLAPAGTGADASLVLTPAGRLLANEVAARLT